MQHANCDFTNPTTEFGWRIRGNSNTKNAGAGNANGWNTSAGTGTQGAEFDAPTTGYTNILVAYDWYVTGQGIADLQPEYNLNTSNSASWVTYGSPVITPTGGGWLTGQTMNLTGLGGANNDPNFGIRLVSTTDPNSGDSTFGQYTSASGGIYNNSSGNWSLNNITITGVSAVPEPSTFALLAISGVSLLFYKVRRRREMVRTGLTCDDHGKEFACHKDRHISEPIRPA